MLAGSEVNSFAVLLIVEGKVTIDTRLSKQKVNPSGIEPGTHSVCLLPAEPYHWARPVHKGLFSLSVGKGT